MDKLQNRMGKNISTKESLRDIIPMRWSNDVLTENKKVTICNKLNEITHNHSIIAIQDTFNEYPNRFLVYDDPQWQCQLFINYKDNENNESFIKDHVSRELKVDISSITVKYISKIISQKVSGRDNKEKVYCHKLFLVKLKDIPKHMRNDTFECHNRIYHWQSILDLENDNEAMKKNSDIIRFVKENI